MSARFRLVYIPSLYALSEREKEEQIINVLLNEVRRLYGIEYEIMNLPDPSNIEEYNSICAQVYEELRRYSKRISKATSYLRGMGINVSSESVAYKFRSRKGRGYVYVSNSLIVYDDQGVLWAGKGREIITFLNALKAKGTDLLAGLSGATRSGKESVGTASSSHDDITARYVAEVLNRSLNAAAVLEYPVGVTLLAHTLKKELGYGFTTDEDYLSRRYKESALKFLAHAFQLRADVIIIKNPRKLKPGYVYTPADSKLFSAGLKVRSTANKLSHYVTRTIMVSSLTLDPLHEECVQLLSGDSITIAEVKSSTDTAAVKEAIGQVLTYSEVIKAEQALTKQPAIPIEKTIVLPKTGSRVNPLLEMVCKVLNINIVHV